MKKWLLGLFLLLIFPTAAMADVGVGVGTGKIYVEEELRAGVIYNLPQITVINTGDVSSDYEISIEFHENQSEIRPDPSWFSFSPDKFYLEPGQAEIIDIRLNLPLRVEPGDYFAFLSAHPAIKVESGDTIIGVAAASKLYFTVHPANVFQAVYFRVLTFWQTYPRLMGVLSGVVILLGVVSVGKRYLNIDIKVKKPADNKEDE